MTLPSDPARQPRHSSPVPGGRGGDQDRVPRGEALGGGRGAALPRQPEADPRRRHRPGRDAPDHPPSNAEHLVFLGQV